MRNFFETDVRQRRRLILCACALAMVLFVSDARAYSWPWRHPGPPPGMIMAQNAQTLVSDAKHATKDRVIQVGPDDKAFGESRMEIGRDQDEGDLVIHVAPPPEQERDSGVGIGPVFISPEITWPDPRKPRQPDTK